jgi:hypothetical protein
MSDEAKITKTFWGVKTVQPISEWNGRKLHETARLHTFKPYWWAFWKRGGQIISAGPMTVASYPGIADVRGAR